VIAGIPNVSVHIFTTVTGLFVSLSLVIHEMSVVKLAAEILLLMSNIHQILSAVVRVADQWVVLLEAIVVGYAHSILHSYIHCV